MFLGKAVDLEILDVDYWLMLDVREDADLIDEGVQ